MRTLIPIAVASLALPAFARTIEGDGKATTQARDVGSFSAIAVKSSVDVVVKIGSPQRVAVTADENLQPHITTTVKSGRLVVDTNESLRPKTDVRVEVTVAELRRVEIDGSGDVVVDGGRGDTELSIRGSGNLRWSGEAGKLEAEIDGSGDIVLAGSAAELVVDLDGSGDVDARKLKAKDANVEIDGAGDVQLQLDGGKLRAEISGAGDVSWSGSGTVERAVASGAGHIRRSSADE